MNDPVQTERDRRIDAELAELKALPRSTPAEQARRSMAFLAWGESISLRARAVRDQAIRDMHRDLPCGQIARALGLSLRLVHMVVSAGRCGSKS